MNKFAPAGKVQHIEISAYSFSTEENGMEYPG